MIKIADNLVSLFLKNAKDTACWKGYKQVGKKNKGGKQVPNCVPVAKAAAIKLSENTPTNPGLWSQAKSKARAKFDVYPSAYANGWAAKWYKDNGGGWKKTKKKSEGSSKQSNLDRWFKEDWVDISKKDESGKHPPCGRSDADEKSGYPKCRPSKRVSEETPETTKSMSKEEKTKAVAQKRRAEAKPREGKKPHMTSHAEKKAYGVEDDYFYTDRYLDGGDIWGMSKQDAIAYTKLLADAASKRNLRLSFYADRNLENSMTPQKAIKMLSAARDQDLQGYDNPKLPYYKVVERGSGLPSYLGPVNETPIDYSDLPEQEAFAALQKAQQQAKPKKTKKKASSLSSESIVDVPIRCTPGFGCKRYLTPNEAMEVEQAQSKIMPNYLATDADPISSQMSSPTWSALGHGALGALLGAGLGAGVGKLTDNNIPISATAGGLAAGLGGGLYGYIVRELNNKKLKALIEELPVGADIGDIDVYSDPRLKQHLARDLQRQLVRRGLMNNVTM